MRDIRISIFMVVVILLCLGVVMVYSSTAVFSYDEYQTSAYFLHQHLLHLLLGIILAGCIMSVDLLLLQRWVKVFFAFSVLLLVLVFLPQVGREVAGAKRWLRLGTLGLQPSELVKWATVLLLADLLADQKKRLDGFKKRFLGPLVILGIVCLIIFIQPDLGTAVNLGVVGILMFFAAGMRPSHITAMFLAALPALYFAVFYVPYRRKRILSFLNPWEDARGIGFQIIQSYIALGLGGIWGVGLGMSRQKLYYLPGAHTDFIFSIIGEELGLVGTTAVLALFVIFLWQGMKIAWRATNAFIKFLSFGIVAGTVLPAAINIAVVCGAVPTKGLPLPFISYGGSSLVFNMMAVGLLLNAGRDRYIEEKETE